MVAIVKDPGQYRAAREDEGIMAKIERLLLCTCEGTQRIDAATASAALGGAQVKETSHLCTRDLDMAERALAQDGTTMIACGQMANLFAEIAAETGADLIATDIRDRAGWTADDTAFAKQAALLAEAALDAPATPVKDVTSEGTILVIGGADALAAGAALADTLAVTVILTEVPDDLVPTDAFDIARGRIVNVTGALGGFGVTVDGYAPLDPGGRGAATFGAAKNGAKSACDIILDLTGADALVPAPHKREGYLRADPARPAAVAEAVAEARQLQGVFEKPLYIRFDAGLCAHSRAKRPGCDRCLSVCPTGAITPAGDVVSIDPDICAGCGACAAVCPSGAAAYDDPPVAFLFQRLRTLATTYRKTAGHAPRALFVEPHGSEMIALLARFGAGLPADVIPVEVPNVEGVGHAEMLAALGAGFTAVATLMGPRTDRTVPERELALAQAISDTPDRLALLDVTDPDALPSALAALTPEAPAFAPILPLGGRRDVTRLTAQAIHGDAAVLALPPGAPYGAVTVNTDACTLCLACVSLCPSGALGDDADKPLLGFRENACLQCGICESTCPESAITLTPRLNLAKEALEQVTLHEEEPFPCISCGREFGVKSTIERIVAKLEGNHWMYTNSDNARLIQMCDDCRVNAQYHQENSPMRMGDRPKIRTTEDELRERDKLN